MDTSPLGARIPLVLVHGWSGSGAPASPSSTAWDPFVRALYARPKLIANFKPYKLLYWSNSVSIDQLGLDMRIALDLASIADPSNFANKQIVIVAHSMGGLVSRAYMRQQTQVGEFAGTEAASRVLRLITLGTPHHGTMMANDEALSDAAAAADASWTEAVTSFLNIYFSLNGLSHDEVNRSELRWDRFDGLFGTEPDDYPNERNYWLEQFNAHTDHDHKLVAYWGKPAGAGGPIEYELGATIIEKVFGMDSDGLVPKSSACLFDGPDHFRALFCRPFEAHNHSELRTGNGTRKIITQIETDLTAVIDTLLPATGLMLTFAGGGGGGMGGQATDVGLYTPHALALDAAGNLYITERLGNQAYKVNAGTGVITLLAGGGSVLGDGGPATAANLFAPRGVAVDGLGNVYVADSGHHRVRKISEGTGTIGTVAGTGVSGDDGDGFPATLSRISSPRGIAVAGNGDVYFVDSGNHRVRKIAAATGLLSTVAGTGIAGFSGDGGPATAAELNCPDGLVRDPAGNLYIADVCNSRIRKVDVATGLIATIAGTGSYTNSGDGGAATAAGVANTADLALDRRGNLYLSSFMHRSVRVVSAETGIVTMVAGRGTAWPGNGETALAVDLSEPRGVVVDAKGNLLIAESAGYRIRMVPLGQIAEVQSSDRVDFTGDGMSDLLWRHATGGDVWLWPMNGASRTAESYVRTVADTNWEIRSQGDQTGDGQADLLWRNKVTGQLYFWPMAGGMPQDEIYVATVDTAYDIVGSGDFNADGNSDLVWHNGLNGEVWLWLMDGATPLSEVYVAMADLAYAVKGVGDLDGDGRADLVWQGTAGDVWVWPMQGTTRLAEVWAGTVPDTGYQIQGVADFTGDGKADLVWWHATRGEVWIWTMNGPTRTAETWVATVPDTTYRIAATGDYDGNGMADIVWHNAATGEVWVWIMNGPVRVSETWVATVPDTGYRIIK